MVERDILWRVAPFGEYVIKYRNFQGGVEKEFHLQRKRLIIKEWVLGWQYLQLKITRILKIYPRPGIVS